MHRELRDALQAQDNALVRLCQAHDIAIPGPHSHRHYVEGCFRCDLSRAEVEAQS